ncbi:dihydrofolate reductase [Youhaiella tibetensis]|uniref:Dihydrofolate reductase n=1 Tax=Paradevosia tibetensis TaxID=1447062 RepID=A0A5B9DS47_9HYPH|nr:dihydrofolate reductase family protein [Youhaiella tibetensis]QEE21174.1 dihydrofolate reductase [Youhaiella tibetensis]GGF17323.1 dihydrofolate reductase [Youhaiella tibetensis]
MARIVGYIASSLDGFIATPDDNLDWLTSQEFDSGEFPYDEFIAGIRTVVMGRGTYDWLEGQEMDWPYHGKRAIVVTSRPLDNPKGELEVWTRGVDDLVAHLRALDDGDVWMLGGGKLQMAFMERGALDEIEIYIVPELIGGGIPMFPATGFRASPKLLSVNLLPPGVVRLKYRFA